ncbi:hypothetical protein L1987_07061 [Smallanthus sonchifolius]|uniref:Uncharacterized protein n=1 Tax=Smallanthus sonchifolius TaxID=185202 RepID=A0ACB9JZT3_9ASTR|nr:hypothetical protein L1987_07061 [Smallanthus sonchifolius]
MDFGDGKVVKELKALKVEGDVRGGVKVFGGERGGGCSRSFPSLTDPWIWGFNRVGTELRCDGERLKSDRICGGSMVMKGVCGGEGRRPEAFLKKEDVGFQYFSHLLDGKMLACGFTELSEVGDDIVNVSVVHVAVERVLRFGLLGRLSPPSASS